MPQGEHSAILSTFIKLPIVINIFVLSFFEWPFYTGFTVIVYLFSEMVCLVIGIFYMLHWEIGGVEAISLSILVGSSVDYCVHLVEGYILAAQTCPIKDVSINSVFIL